jgi:gliding motility-associated-like protein
MKNLTTIQKITTLCLFLIGLEFHHANAQFQANVWHFGNGRALDFSTGVPVNITGSQMFSAEGCASYADAYGSFMFYTNGGGRETNNPQEGGHIWNRNNAIMHAMNGVEGGGYSSKQSSVILEAPNQDSVYYVFTMDEFEWDQSASAATLAAQPNGRGLSYFTVDMRLNNGMGGVVLADQRVYAPSAEALCAVRHANGRDFWIIINQDSTGYGVYSLTPAGVSLNNVYSAQIDRAIIKASPNGAYVVSASIVPAVGAQTIIYQFNNATGQLSNPVGLPIPNIILSWEFSPNSRYLYTFERPNGFNPPYNIERYDLQAPNIPASSIVVGNTSNLVSDMQLAPDGKIYFCTWQFLAPFTTSINRINCPNTSSANLELSLFNYLNPMPMIGLPNYSSWIFENYDSTFVALGPDTIDLCLFSGSYTINALNPGSSYLWSTGETTQSITITTPGTYSVTVNGPCGIGTDQVVVINCNTCVPTTTAINATGCENYTAPWGAVYTQSGIYSDTLLSINGCDSIIQLDLTISGFPIVSASSVSGTCGLANATASATAIGGSGNYTYSWSNGATGSFISGLSSGSYSVVATDQNGCSSTSQVIVNTSPASGIILNASDTIIGLNESVTLEIVGGDTYNWSPTTGLNCANCQSVVAAPQVSTTYTVTGFDNTGCPYLRVINVVVDIVCSELFVPDIFSPNGEGNTENEKLCVYSNCIKKINFGIYNRWGELIFTTDDQTACWDGTHQGTPVMTGVYAYRLFIEQYDGEKIERAGFISLVR